MLNAQRQVWPWAALPVAAVLAVDPSGLTPFGPIKWALIPALILLGTATGTTPAQLVMFSRENLDSASQVVKAWALPAFVGWAAVAAVFGSDGLYAWIGTPERHFGVLTWVLVLLCWWAGRSFDAAQRRVVLTSAMATGAALGAWAGAEALGWEPLRLVGIGDRPVGTLGSSAFLGAVAALLAPIGIGWASSTDASRRTRVAAAMASTLGLVALAASGARAALFGAGVVALLAFAVRRNRGAIVVVGASVSLVVVVALATGAGGRVSAVASDREGGAHGRLDEWRIATRVVAAHPIIGTGPEGYRIAFGAEVDDRYERTHGRNPLPDRAHSAPLDVAATTGVVGLVLYALAVGGAALAALKQLRHGDPLLAAAGVGVVAYFTQSLFLFPVAELEPIAWLLAGMCATPLTTLSPQAPRRRFIAAIAGVLAAAALGVGVLDVVADRRAKRTLAAIADDTPAAATVANLRPDQVRYHLVDAQAHESPGATRGIIQAIADVDEALDVSPRDPVARREKARLLVALARRSNAPANAKQRALAYLEQLAQDDPRNAEVLLRLGIARDLTGDTQGAVVAWRRAEYLAPKSGAASSNLAVAYAQQGRTSEARNAAKRALARDPDNGPAQQVLDSLDNNDGT